MLKLFIDQDFDHDILRGLLQRIPNLDTVTAFEAGLRQRSAENIFNFLLRNVVVVDVGQSCRRIDVIANLHAAILRSVAGLISIGAAAIGVRITA